MHQNQNNIIAAKLMAFILNAQSRNDIASLVPTWHWNQYSFFIQIAEKHEMLIKIGKISYWIFYNVVFYQKSFKFMNLHGRQSQLISKSISSAAKHLCRYFIWRF